jgi:trimethylamine--corrinoid protein Co-methyltransferase
LTAATFVNAQPRYEILSEEALEVLDGGWRRLISEIGVQFDHPRALELFAGAGQAVEGDIVRLDPEFVLEQVALAPGEFAVRARNPERSVAIGGDRMCFTAVQGPPFVREGTERRDATLADLESFIRLSHVFDEIDVPGSVSAEPSDLPLDSRHLDMVRAALVLSDKPLIGSQISLAAAEDSIALARIAFGDDLPEPSVFSNVNVNSPLRYDGRMLDALLVYAAAGQPALITPFLLMGAMSPVTIPAALVQQLAEVLAGVALAQLVRPGTPVVLGSFLSHTDMQSGSPGFGGPEAATGLFCSGQLARRLGLPWRSGGGGLTTSQTVDAQSAYEALHTLLPAFLAGANVVVHAAGWLEAGLVSCYEKFIVDIELVRMLRHEFAPLEIDEASLAYGAHEEVRHGGHFLGAAHTLERFRDCFYRPLLSSTENFERWERNGSLDTAARAARLWREALERYEEPPLDAAVRDELDAYVSRRRRELGD